MQFSKNLIRLPNRKIRFFIVILLVITIGILWYVGIKSKNIRQAKIERYYAALVNKDQNLKSIVAENLKTKGQLQNFDPNLIYEEASTTLITSNLGTSTPEDFTAYLQTLKKVFAPLQTAKQNEAKLMLLALDSKDRNLLKEVTAARIKYQTISDALGESLPPAELIVAHRQLLQTTKRLALLTSNMEKVLDEPVLALESGQAYLAEMPNLPKFVNIINQYYLEKNLIKNQSDKIVINLTLS